MVNSGTLLNLNFPAIYDHEDSRIRNHVLERRSIPNYHRLQHYFHRISMAILRHISQEDLAAEIEDIIV